MRKNLGIVLSEFYVSFTLVVFLKFLYEVCLNFLSTPFLHEITFEDFTKTGGKTKLIKCRTEKVLRFLCIKVLTEKEVLLTT